MITKLSIKNLFSISFYSLIAIVVLVIAFLGIYIYKPMYDSYKIEAQNLVVQFKKSIESTIKTTMQVGNSIAYDKAVQKMLNTSSNIEKVELSSEIDRLVNAIAVYNENIYSITMMNSQGDSINLYSSSSFNDYKLMNDIYSDYQTGVKVVKSSNENYGKYYFCYIRPVFYTSGSVSTQIGCIFVLCDMTSLQNSIAAMQFSKRSSVSVIDGNGFVILSNDKHKIGEKINDTGILKTALDIEKTDLKTVSSSVEVTKLADINIMVSFLFIIIIIFIFMIGLINIGFKLAVANPIKKIVNSMAVIGKTNLSRRIEVNVNPDLAIITREINDMLMRIEELTHTIVNSQQRLYEMELLNEKSQFLSLQWQINPHFLYNTLECIRSIATERECKEISTISVAMARMFRYSIQQSENVTLKEEISIILEYMKIINIRFPQKVKMIIDIDDELYNKPIIKMVLQPVVENAVRHGFGQITGKGNLKITACEKGKGIVITVSDNGCGINEKKLRKIREELNCDVNNSPNIGLFNVNNRIRLYYGKDFGISIDSICEKGTNVEIYIPLN